MLSERVGRFGSTTGTMTTALSAGASLGLPAATMKACTQKIKGMQAITLWPNLLSNTQKLVCALSALRARPCASTAKHAGVRAARLTSTGFQVVGQLRALGALSVAEQAVARMEQTNCLLKLMCACILLVGTAHTLTQRVPDAGCGTTLLKLAARVASVVTHAMLTAVLFCGALISPLFFLTTSVVSTVSNTSLTFASAKRPSLSERGLSL
jgi:hypothetical protein